MTGPQLTPVSCRSDCLIKTIRSEGYFGMYRGEAGGGAGVGGTLLHLGGGRWQSQAGQPSWAWCVSVDVARGT